MIKIIERLRKYFFSKSKKMCLSSKVTELQNELLENCKYAISCLEAAERKVTHFASSNQMPTITGSPEPSVTNLSTPSVTGLSIQFPQMSGSKSDDATSYEITDKELLNRFMILTHGVLIQEWEHFLYDVFVEGVIYYLRGYDLYPDCKLNLKNLKPGIEVAEMRKNISAEVKKSHWGYENLFEKSRELFQLQDPKLFAEMQKHVQIRHVFQHNRGIIRESDITKIGIQYFEILNDEGKPIRCAVNDKIPLSRQEIEKLYDTVERYSQAFQIQAEKAKPITE